jgi:peptidoglycan/xylan/chitin deacetylase (PgdA/CDA1 family)
VGFRALLNHLSLNAVIALSLAVLTVFSARLGSHYGIVGQLPFLTAPVSMTRPVGSGHDDGSGAVPRTSASVGSVSRTVDLGAEVDAAFLDGSTSPEPVLVSPSPLTTSVGAPGRPAGSMWIPILMYHYVRTAPPGDRMGFALSVTPPDFQRQMQYLKDHGYTTLTMRDADLIITQQKAMPIKPVVLTFDDGYNDFYSTAAPIMSSLGITATNYVPTHLVGGSYYMTWDQIQELDQTGFEMAAHTMFHTALAHQSAGRVQSEVFGSKADLENHLGHPVVDFAYPFGSYDAQAIRTVRDAGFWSATSTVAGGWHDPTQMMWLTRVRVGGGESFGYWVRTLSP